MAQRTVALYKGNYIGIETIYTVVDGKQINIPEKLVELRKKSRQDELFCPCGCGANLILVAGDRNLREQHFRIKDGENDKDCHVVTEGRTSVDSKIVLKCWLDDKLKARDIESRVQIQAVDGMARKYEFTLLSKTNSLAINYCHERTNLSDEKLEILEANSKGIRIIHVVDEANRNTYGQYPEHLMKIQKRQGFCLLLSVKGTKYNDAKLKAVYYAKDLSGVWNEIEVSDRFIADYAIKDGDIILDGRKISDIVTRSREQFNAKLQAENKRRIEAERRRKEEIERAKRSEQARKAKLEKIRQWQKEEREKAQKAEYERIQSEKKRLEEEKKKREEDFIRSIQNGFLQQDVPWVYL